MRKDIYAKIAHPLRKDIILYLGEHGPSRYTEIAKKLKISVGSFYYHIKILEGLVEKREGLYRLTPEGVKAYEMLLGVPRTPLSLAYKLFNVATLRPLHQLFFRDWRLAIVALLLSLSISTYLGVKYRRMVFLLSAYTGSPPIILITPLASLMAIYLFVEASSLLLRGRTARLSSLTSISTSLLIVSLYGVVEPILTSSHFGLRIAYYVLQAEAILTLSQGISVSKGFTVSQALAVSLVIAYVSVILAP